MPSRQTGDHPLRLGIVSDDGTNVCCPAHQLPNETRRRENLFLVARPKRRSFEVAPRARSAKVLVPKAAMIDKQLLLH